MDKAPFSIHDFLGYLIAGIFAICMFAFFYNYDVVYSFDKLSSIKCIANSVTEQIYTIKLDSIGMIVIYSILSYIVGHLVL